VTARYLAVKALLRQEKNGYANLVLDAELKNCKPSLTVRDAAFAGRIFYTVVERQHILDHTLSKFISRPLAKLDPPIRAILRAGLAQARYMQVPVPAAVNESVKLAKAYGKTSAAGMVNAVLRRAAAEKVTPEDFPDPLQALEVYYNLSREVADLLYSQYGDEALEMAQAFYNRLPTAIRVNTMRTTDEKLAEELEKEGHQVSVGPWPHSLLVEFAGSPAATAPFREGIFHVQGLASQYAARSLGARPGEKVCDLCAAPGGKSLTIAQQMQDKGILRSGELVPGRVRLLRQAFERCGVRCAEAVCADASEPLTEVYDRILCDVPCSGLGVIAKKPDIRYKTLSGIRDLEILQQKILQNAAKSLAETGRLVYSTCTVNYSENQAQIREFLAENKEFHVVPPDIELPGANHTEWGTLFLPHKCPTDGFFVAILEKRR